MGELAQPRVRDAKSTRLDILKKASDLFSEKGYAATSMSDLASALGLSKAGIYHHFESKESILKNLVGSTLSEINALLSEYEKLPIDKVDQRQVLQRFAETVYIHRQVIHLVLSQLPVEMKGKENAHSNFIVRLQRILVGDYPSVDSAMRARAALTLIATGFVPPPFDRILGGEEVDLTLLVAIAVETLKLEGVETE